MKKIFAFVMAIAMLLCCAACGNSDTAGNRLDEIKERGYIEVVTEPYFAPFEFIYDGAVTGLDIAIMNEVAVNMGKKIVVKDIVFDTIPTSVQSDAGLAVAAAGLTINAERAEKMDFSNVYYSSTLVIVSDKEAPITSVKDLAGKKVGVQQGTSGDLIITDAAAEKGFVYTTENDAGEEITVTVKAAGAEIKQYEKYAMALADLKAGRIDGMIFEANSVMGAGLPSEYWLREWVERVKNTEVPD